MALREGHVDIEKVYSRVHRGEFAPLDIEASFNRINLYSGADEIREFDLASRLHLIGSGHTIHALKRADGSRKTQINLDAPSLTVVTFNSRRNLVSRTAPENAHPNHPYYLHKDTATKTAGFHPNPDPSVYNLDKWIEVNQKAIELSLAHEADIICFGEFDFPSSSFENHSQHKDAVESIHKHERWIKDVLPTAKGPTLLFGGSAHQWNVKTGNGCTNVGRIFISEVDSSSAAMTCELQSHEKRTSAKSLGEVLRPFPKPELSFYSTSFGNIGILICIDAFDPGIITSVFANSRNEIRTAYLAYWCQPTMPAAASSDPASN